MGFLARLFRSEEPAEDFGPGTPSSQVQNTAARLATRFLSASRAGSGWQSQYAEEERALLEQDAETKRQIIRVLLANPDYLEVSSWRSVAARRDLIGDLLKNGLRFEREELPWLVSQVNRDVANLPAPQILALVESTLSGRAPSEELHAALKELASQVTRQKQSETVPLMSVDRETREFERRLAELVARPPELPTIQFDLPD